MRKIPQQNNVKEEQCFVHIIRCNNPSLAFHCYSCQIKVEKTFYCFYFIADTENLQSANPGLSTITISSVVQVQNIGDDNRRGTTPSSVLPSYF